MAERAKPERSAAGQASALGAARPALNGYPEQSFWDQFLSVASPAERIAWLASADAGGIVYAHGLAKGSEQHPHLLEELLAGRTGGLSLPPPCESDLIPPADAELDATQVDAVRRALASPDVFLIQGAPGTGKSRVVAELITQAVARNWRVLVLSPGKAALDTVLERLAGRTRLLPVRCLGANEDPASLAPAVRALTYAAWSARAQSEPAERLQAQVEALHARAAAARRDCDALAQLRVPAAEWEVLERQRRDLEASKQSVAQQVGQEGSAARGSSSLTIQVDAETIRHQQTMASLNEELHKTEADCQARAKEHQSWIAERVGQERIVAARDSGSIFQWSYWRSLFQGRAKERLAEFQSREREADAARAAAQAFCDEVMQRRANEVQRHQAAVEQHLQHEITRRQGEIDRGLVDLSRPQLQLVQFWTDRREALADSSVLPTLPDEKAVLAAQHAAEQMSQQAQEQTRFLETWRRTVGELKSELPKLIHRAINIVASGTADLAGDPHFGDRAAEPLVFDLVILEQADRLPESDLLQHARRGLRCVLLGQSPLPEDGDWGLTRTTTPFQRLWQALHCDPRRLPYQWVESSSRLSCQLLPCESEPHARFETERLVDHPDVELRIVSRPNTGPTLAEVVFPMPKFVITSAKAYLFQHLGEVTLRPGAAALLWREEPDRLILDTADGALEKGTEERVELAEGVTEVVLPLRAGAVERGTRRWGTVRLEFERAMAWDRPRAEAWLRERANLATLDRTALLETQWRAVPELVAKLTGLLGEAPPRACRNGLPHVEILEMKDPVHFLPVPYHRDRPRLKTRGPQRPAPPPAKAFEIDLADPKQRQRLPLDVQLKLPARGIVNFAEAQAIVHLLDQISQAARHLRLAVLSWQSPQIQFLEALWAKHDASAGRPGVAFDTPAGFRDREADVVFLSLCRSVAQRAVGYADCAEDWRWALGAARRQLVLVGDAETMARRASWQGPVNRQSEFAAHVERRLVHRLLKDAEPASLAVVVASGART